MISLRRFVFMVWVIIALSVAPTPFVLSAGAQTEESQAAARAELERRNDEIFALYESGRYSEAILRAETAMNMAEVAFGAEDPDTLASVNNLAFLYQSQGRDGDAEPLYERALEAKERVLGKDNPSTLASVNNLAFLYQSQGRYGDAEPLYVRALEAGERVLGKDHPSTLNSVNNLAFLYQSQGRYGDAEPLYGRALSAAERKFGAEHIDMRAFYGNYASFIGEKLDQPAAAIFFMKQAVNVLQAARANMAGLSDTTQAAFLEKNIIYYENLQSWLIEAGRFAEAEQVGRMIKEQEYFEFIRRDSGDGEDPRQTRSMLTPREEDWAKQLASWSERPNQIALAREGLEKKKREGLVLTALETKQLADLDQQYEVAYAAYKVSVNKWLEGVRQISETQMRAEAEQVKKLADDARQEEIAKIGPDVAEVQIVALEDKLHFFLITPGAFKHVEKDVPRKDVFAAVADARKYLDGAGASRRGGPAGGGTQVSDTEMKASLKALHDLLVAPIAQELEDAGTKTLMLNLQGQLRYVPFAALHDGETYLMQRFDLALYTPAAQTKFDGSGALKTASGFGVSDAHGGFSALPAVRDELSGVIKPTGAVLRGTPVFDTAFTRDALETALGGNDPVLHIASHFKMQPGNDAMSYLLLGDGKALTLAEINQSSKLRFLNVELLTLSACSTGLSNEGTGAEVEGLGVLAQTKGADAVMATLWNVADKSSPVFMEAFYRHLTSGKMSKAEALATAQRDLLASSTYSHPFYWAPYVLMGDWK